LPGLVPFTQAQFLEVFRQYNQGVSIGQSLILMVGIVGLCFAFWDNRVAGRVVNGSLAVLWLWMAIAYFLVYFSRLSSSAPLFAVVFIAQAALFAWAAVRDTGLRYRFSNSILGWLGAIAIVYSVAVYPALGFVFGHYYPAAPTFGAPSPTVIFTLGLLMWSTASWRAIAIPVLAAIVGTVAAVSLHIPQDYALAPVALLLIFLPRQRLQ